MITQFHINNLNKLFENFYLKVIDILKILFLYYQNKKIKNI